MTIVVYGTFRCRSADFNDPLTRPLLSSSPIVLDGWAVTHFLFFMFLGWCFPSEWVFLFVLGVLWEVLETFAKDHPFYLTQCASTNNHNHNQTGWWYGRWEDIVYNGMGLAAGIYLKLKLLK